MGSWSLPTTAAGYEADFGRRYEAYAQMLKRQGINGEELKTRLGNYSKELQKRMQTIPGNKAVGQEFAREIAQQRSVTNQLHQALNGKGVTPANFTTHYGNLNHLYAQGPVGNIAGEYTTTYGSAEQLRNSAPTGNIAPGATGNVPTSTTLSGNVTKEGGKYVVNMSDGTTRKFTSEKLANEYLRRQLRNSAPLGDVTKAPVIKGSSAVFPTADGNAYAKMLEENPIKGNTPAQPKGLTPEAKIALDNARRAEAGAKFQGTSQAAMDKLHSTGYDKNLSKYYAELEANNKPVKLPEGTSGIRRNPPIGDPTKLKYLPDGKLPEVKPNTQGGGFWSKLWKGAKNNKGKIGLAVGALALVGTAIGVSQCSDDKKAAPVDNKDGKNANDSTAVKKNDAPKQAPQGTNGELKPGQTIVVDGQFHVVKKGECPWSIAADILKKQGKTDNASILEYTRKIMANNNLQFANDEGLVIIHPNDTLDVRM